MFNFLKLSFHLNLIRLGETTYSYLMKQHREELRANIRRNKSGKSFHQENDLASEPPVLTVETTADFYATMESKRAMPWLSKNFQIN